MQLKRISLQVILERDLWTCFCECLPSMIMVGHNKIVRWSYFKSSKILVVASAFGEKPSMLNPSCHGREIKLEQADASTAPLHPCHQCIFPTICRNARIHGRWWGMPFQGGGWVRRRRACAATPAPTGALEIQSCASWWLELWFCDNESAQTHYIHE